MIAGADGEMVKLCVTFEAASKIELPLWAAAIVHVPLVTNVTVLDDTVQTAVVELVKLTESPDVEDASSVRYLSLRTLFPGLSKVITCVLLIASKVPAVELALFPAIFVAMIVTVALSL